MRKTFFWAVTALALLPGVVERANAQATGAADVAADASAAADGQSVAETATGAADAATDSASEAATGQSDATAPATPSADASANASADAAAADADAAASADAPTSVDAATDAAAAGGAQPAAQPQADTAGNAGIDAKMNGAATNGVASGASAQAGLDAQANPANISAGLQFGAATERGITLNSVANDSFLYRSGLRQGDVLISYGGRPIRSQADFNRWAIYQPGQRVPLVVWRDGREETIFVTYDQRPMQRQAGYVPQSGGAYLGVTFDPQSNRGALVRAVAPGSPAARSGIQPGQIIVAINDRRIAHFQEVIDYVATLQPGQEIDLVVVHRLALTGRPAQASPATQAVGTVGIESSVISPAPAAGVPAAAEPAPAFVTPAVPAPAAGPRPVARPGDADRDGRVLDGDGRIGPLERGGRR